jgi:hypothetical protein
MTLLSRGAALPHTDPKAGLPNAEIEIDLVNQLERHKETGKLKRFIPLAKS